MATDQPIPELDRAGLRRFGLVTGAVVAGLFGLALPWLLDRPVPVWPWGLFLVLGTWALVAPNSLRFVYKPWMRLALLLNMVTTPLIMGVIFPLVIVPVGMVMRVAGRDPLKRKIDRDVDSYRVASSQPSKDNLTRPF